MLLSPGKFITNIESMCVVIYNHGVPTGIAI